MITSLARSGARFARSTAALITVAPRSVAFTGAKWPRKLPNRVRAADTITMGSCATFISILQVRSRVRCASKRVQLQIIYFD